MTIQEDREILLRAAEILDKGKLIKGEFRDYQGGYCLMGAIAEAQSTRNSYGNLYRLSSLVHPKSPRWNDKWYRTKGQVVRRMRKTARNLNKEQ
jgi:hypothetical protein